MFTHENVRVLVPERSSGAQAAALILSFVGAIVLGIGLGSVLQPNGDATTAIVTFSLLLVFMGGMALWGMIAASIMAKAFFSGDFVHSLWRFFLRGRRRVDLPRLGFDRERIRQAAIRVFGWTRVFVWLAVAIAFLAAPLAGWFATSSFLAASAGTATVVIAYGCTLRALARAGYLIPPDTE
jgi:hypothetical protein